MGNRQREQGRVVFSKRGAERENLSIVPEESARTLRLREKHESKKIR